MGWVGSSGFWVSEGFHQAGKKESNQGKKGIKGGNAGEDWLLAFDDVRGHVQVTLKKKKKNKRYVMKLINIQ